MIGGILGRLDAKDVQLAFMEEVVGIGEHTVDVRNVYSLRDADARRVRLGRARLRQRLRLRALRRAAQPSSPDVHVLGDAYAPRRLVFATRQAYALAEQLVTTAAR